MGGWRLGGNRVTARLCLDAVHGLITGRRLPSWEEASTQRVGKPAERRQRWDIQATLDPAHVGRRKSGLPRQSFNRPPPLPPNVAKPDPSSPPPIAIRDGGCLATGGSRGAQRSEAGWTARLAAAVGMGLSENNTTDDTGDLETAAAGLGDLASEGIPPGGIGSELSQPGVPFRRDRLRIAARPAGRRMETSLFALPQHLVRASQRGAARSLDLRTQALLEPEPPALGRSLLGRQFRARAVTGRPELGERRGLLADVRLLAPDSLQGRADEAGGGVQPEERFVIAGCDAMNLGDVTAEVAIVSTANVALGAVTVVGENAESAMNRPRPGPLAIHHAPLLKKISCRRSRPGPSTLFATTDCRVVNEQ